MTWVEIVRTGAVLIAAAVIGNWFMAEQKKNKIKGRPWHAAYRTPPGIIILVVIFILPLVLLAVKQ